MNNRLFLPFLLLAGLSVMSACGSNTEGGGEQGCPITQPQTPVFEPPEPWSVVSPYENTFWYGNEDLWVMLQSDGTWRSLPDADGGYVQKLVWWNANYDWQEEPMPDITVRGRRLDGEAPDFNFSDGTNMSHSDVGSAMLIGVSIPSLGCWEITGVYRGAQLSYVVRLED